MSNKNWKFLLMAGILFLGQGFATDAWNGKEYAKNNDSQKSSAEDLFSRYAFKGNEVVLDVGCGDGKVTAVLAEKLPEGSVTGVDLSPAMIEFAKSKYERGISNIFFQVKDASKLDFSSKFDLITSFTAMHWVLDQLGALQGFERSLKPGGKVWIQIPTGLPTAMVSALQTVIAKDKWKPYFLGFSPPWKFYTPAEYRDLLVDAKLKPTRLEVYTKEEAFPSREAFQGFIKQWFPYLRPLPENLKEPFLNELMDCYLEVLPPTKEGKVQFIVQRLEVEAKKG